MYIAIFATLAAACSCSQKKKKVEKKIVEVVSAQRDTTDSVPLQQIDIAMVVRSLSDELNMGGELDSANYDLHAVMTDGHGKPLYVVSDSVPGDWEVHVESPRSVVVRNLKLGNLLAEDLRIYIANALGLSDSDVIEAGIASGSKDTQAVVYERGKMRLEITMRPENDKNGKEHVWMAIALIRKGKKS